MISNYSELRVAVVSILQRADLTADVPNMIQLAESQINQRLESRFLEKIGSITTTTGVETVAAPSDLMSVKNVKITSVSPYEEIEVTTPDSYRKRSENGQTGQPTLSTAIGLNFYFNPVPDADYTVSIVYQGRIIALSDANPTNDILTVFPDVYLYGALANAAPYINDNRIPVWRDLFMSAIDGANKSDWNQGANAVLRTEVPASLDRQSFNILRG